MNTLLKYSIGLVLLATASTAHAESDAHKAGGATNAASHDADSKAGHQGGHWGYEGAGGPEHWGDLSADYQLCKAGQTQSPVDLEGKPGATVGNIDFDYRVTPLEIVHNGHTVQINYAPGSSITVEGERFELLQFHFHTPSEHAVRGKRTPLEVHFVHKNAAGELAVVGVMLENGGENLALGEIWQAMPMRTGPARSVENVMINGRDLLPHDTTFYRYMGSLTTPPCGEGVNWFVMRAPNTASIGQIQHFAEAVGHNARPLQPINYRFVLTPGDDAESVY